jgi:hypothetical protein
MDDILQLRVTLLSFSFKSPFMYHLEVLLVRSVIADPTQVDQEFLSWPLFREDD